MKAITIKQPWAWAIIFGGKDVENRSWCTRYRGPLAIHAGAAYRTDVSLPRGVHAPERAELRFSAILGVVELVDVVQKSRSRWFQGKYGFVLRNPRPLAAPVQCKGRLGLWTLTPAHLRLIEARLKQRRARAGRPNKPLQPTAAGRHNDPPLTQLVRPMAGLRLQNLGSNSF
jgi:hypothetical protein